MDCEKNSKIVPVNELHCIAPALLHFLSLFVFAPFVSGNGVLPVIHITLTSFHFLSFFLSPINLLDFFFFARTSLFFNFPFTFIHLNDSSMIDERWLRTPCTTHETPLLHHPNSTSAFWFFDFPRQNSGTLINPEID